MRAGSGCNAHRLRRRLELLCQFFRTATGPDQLDHLLSEQEAAPEEIDAIRLEEGTYPPVYYFPRKDVKTDRLVRSSHHTHCPFKGDASYYSFKNGAENAVWSYEQPFDEMQALKQRLAFYPDKVEIKVL